MQKLVTTISWQVNIQLTNLTLTGPFSEFISKVVRLLRFISLRLVPPIRVTPTSMEPSAVFILKFILSYSASLARRVAVKNVAWPYKGPVEFGISAH